MTLDKRLIFVSNRLPVTIAQTPDGPHLVPSSGGLVTALRPLLHERDGYWVGWTGTESGPEITNLVRPLRRRHDSFRSHSLRKSASTSIADFRTKLCGHFSTISSPGAILIPLTGKHTVL